MTLESAAAMMEAVAAGTAMARLFALGLARDLPVVFPLHPRTRKMIELGPINPGVRLLEPLGYLEFLSLEADAGAVLTDSGGIQDETTYLGVPCFTLRDNTERPVTVRAGTNQLLGLDPSRIADIPGALTRFGRRAPTRPPGWDGHAAERLAAVICGDVTDRESALLGATEPGMAA